MERNKRTMWLSTFTKAELTDEDGVGIGEFVNKWTEPVMVRINASAPSGGSDIEPFGTEVSYDLVLVSDGNPWGVKEGDTMWLSDDAPEVVNGVPDMDGAYRVSRVSPSLSYVAFGLTKKGGE